MTEEGSTSPPPPRRWRQAFRAFSHRNYRWFFVGQAVSLIGSWMQQTAMPWLVFGLTGSAFLLGVVSFCARIPAFFLTPVAGVAADRFDRRRLLLATQTLALGQALLLGLLTWFGWIETWHVIVLALVSGVAGAFNLPAAQAFIAEVVEEKDDLGSAVALNAAMTNLTRVGAPALAGVLITVAGSGSRGEGLCFLINAVSYLVLLAVLLIIRPVTATPRETADQGVLESLREGAVYVWREPPLRFLLILAALIGLAGTPGNMLALFADRYDGARASNFGFLVGATSLGAVFGAVYVATQRAVRGAGWRIALGAAILGGSTIGFAYASELWLALLWRVIAGCALVVQMTSATTLVQVICEDSKRGRVLSLFGMAFLGMSPLGNLLTGWLASASSAELAFAVNGSVCLVAGLWFAARVRRIRTFVKEQRAQHDAAALAHAHH